MIARVRTQMFDVANLCFFANLTESSLLSFSAEHTCLNQLLTSAVGKIAIRFVKRGISLHPSFLIIMYYRILVKVAIVCTHIQCSGVTDHARENDMNCIWSYNKMVTSARNASD